MEVTMNCFNLEQPNRVAHLIKEIEKLSDIEKLFLYLQLPSGAEASEAKQKVNGRSNSDLFAKKPDQETTQTYTWILSHLEEDSNVSLPKQEVYDEYRAFCQANRFEPLCVADFGKAMKHAFPCIKPRRLGQRGNSRYCYSGLRKKYKIQPPTLPDLIEPTFCIDNDCSQTYNQIIKECHDNPNECVLNGGQSCEVMNLKVEPHNSYNCTSNSNGLSYAVNETKHQPDQMMLNKPSRPHMNSLQMPHISSNYSQPSSMQPQSLTSSHLNQPSTSHHFSSPPKYTCSSDFMPQRTVTPDDDDYRHNYMGHMPMDCHLGLACSRPIHHVATPTFGSDASQPTSASETTSFVYPPASAIMAKLPHQEDSVHIKQQHQTNGDINMIQQPVEAANLSTTTVVATTTSNTNLIATNNRQQQNSQLQQQQQQQPQFLGDNTTNNLTQSAPISSSLLANAHQLSNIYNSNIDFCASPFQSPASTPYPVMGNYLTQDVPDYCLNDCIRYVDQQQ